MHMMASCHTESIQNSYLGTFNPSSTQKKILRRVYFPNNNVYYIYTAVSLAKEAFVFAFLRDCILKYFIMILREREVL